MKLFAVSILISAVAAFHLWQIHTEGYIAIHWYSPALFYLAIYAWVLYLTNTLVKGENRKNIMLLCTTLFCLVLGVEILLRINGRIMTYHEKRYGYYKSPFEVDQQTWYHTWSANDTHYLENKEFKYKRITNSLGLSDIEPKLKTDTNEIRILTLGDSFTEGDGAPYDSSYPQLLKDIAATKYPNTTFTIINAGVSGSDPYYDYVMFRDKLIQYKPDIVLCTISENDLLDIYYRGGINRFNKDGTVSYNPPPKLETAIAISAALRLFTVPFYRKSIIPRWQQKDIFDSEMESLNTIYKSMDSIGSKQSFKVHLLIRPDAVECEKGEYNYDYSYLVNEINELPTTTYTNLLEMYKAAGITGDNTYKYYWAEDKHHNAAGYKIMAESTFKNINPLIDSLVATRYSAK